MLIDVVVQVRNALLDIKRFQDGNAAKLSIFLKELHLCDTKMKEIRTEIRQVSFSSSFSAFTLCKLHQNILHFCWNTFDQRLRGQRLEIADTRLDDTMREYLKIHPQRMVEILEESGGHKRGSLSQLEVGTRMEELTRTLAKYCKDLHDIFRHYRYDFSHTNNI